MRRFDIDQLPTGSYSISGSFSGSFSGLFQGDGSGLTGITATINTSSLVTTSSFNSFTSSIQTEVDNLTAQTSSYVTNSQTGSFATTGSNNFIGNQIISGSLNVTSSFTASGLNYPTVDGENGDVIQTDGAGNLSFGRTRIYAQVKNVSGVVLPKGIPVHVTSSVGNLDEVIAASASDASTMPATFVLAQQLNDEEEGLGILTGFINGVDTSGFNEGDIVYVAPNGGYTNQKPSGSNLIQNLGIVTKVDVNGSGFIYGSGRSNDVPNLLSGQIFFGSDSDQAQQIHISGALDQTIINNITASGNISSSGIVYGITGSFSYLQGNSSITVGDSITFQQPITGSNILLTSSIVDFDTEVSRSAEAAGFGAGGGISAVVDDTSPQLGGNLNLNSQDITGTGNISIDTTSTATPLLLLTSTNDTSDASPIIDLKRNSSSPSNGNYLGQIKFKGENDNNQEVVYAKITGKISDVTDTTEDGLIEFATKRAGTNVINARLTSTDLKLINGTGLEVDGTINAGDINATGAVTSSNLYVENELWTIELIDAQTVDFYAPYNLTINSYDTVVSASAVTFLDDGSSYTTGSLITAGSKITVTSTSATVINLNTSR